MFDYLVEPILLYGSEIWKNENIDIIEKVHLQFCKRILNVKSSTPNVMVYGELGRFTLEIKVKIRMTSFWRRIMHGDKLSSNMYRLLLSLMQNSGQSFKWLNFIESIFNDTKVKDDTNVNFGKKASKKRDQKKKKRFSKGGVKFNNRENGSRVIKKKNRANK